MFFTAHLCMRCVVVDIGNGMFCGNVIYAVFSSCVWQWLHVSHHLLSLRTSVQDYKMRMGMEIVITVHKSTKNICLKSQEVKSV
jgi:hypothetical protein